MGQESGHSLSGSFIQGLTRLTSKFQLSHLEASLRKHLFASWTGLLAEFTPLQLKFQSQHFLACWTSLSEPRYYPWSPVAWFSWNLAGYWFKFSRRIFHFNSPWFFLLLTSRLSFKVVTWLDQALSGNAPFD